MMQTSVPETGRRFGVTGPVVLITMGALFLAVNFGLVDDLGKLWPVALIAGGVALLFDRLRK